MNPAADQLPPPPPLQPPRPSFTCDRHPDDKFTGFCPSCLCERLTTLDQSAAASSSSSRRNSTSSSTAALKSVFRASNTISEANKTKITATATTTFFPELRRTKSFSASKNDGLGFSAGVFEPQRKSCDVRGRNTLWSLFSIDDENKPNQSSSVQQQTLGNAGTVLETNREEEEDQIHSDDDEIKLSKEQFVRDLNDLDNDIVEEKDEIEDDLKTMKDHIDLDSHSKKPSLSNLWSAASVLSKKWQKWRRKQKKDAGINGVVSSSTLPVEKPISRQYRETQSEIADYGFGRRSCDIDPRFSLDAGRVSFDDPRYSFDEPRASWDGYLIGRTFPRLPPMVEEVPVLHVTRSDTQIPVEENIPGGSIQTREYYTDSSSKRRKSLDRSNSIKKMAASVVAEMEETKPTTAISNAKVSPATMDYHHSFHGGSKIPNVGCERELARDSNSNSLRDDCSETFELGIKGKKSRRWTWKLWGFTNRQREGNSNGEIREGINKKVLRSNSSVSFRNSSYNIGTGHGNGNLERNRSARFSPNHIDNGLLRFYLTPLKGSRRAGIGIGTGKSKASSMLRLY